MSVFRYDNGSLRAPERLADGRLRVDGYLTRSGVFTYRNADGTPRREYRPEVEVFKADSLSTFEDAIVTDDHPAEMVSATNARDVGVGFVSGAPRRDGDHVAARLVISDAATIAKVEAGKAELSCGYACDLDETPGTSPAGERYDAVQTNIRGNHVAIVHVARAGRSARMRVDAAEQEPPVTDLRSPVMDELQKALAKALLDVAAQTARADVADATLAAAKAAHEAAIATAAGRADSAEKDLVAERKARTDAAATEGSRIRARLELEAQAGALLPAGTKLDGLDDGAVRRAVVKHLDGVEPAADAHPEYVRALFEGACKRAAAETEAHAGVRGSVVAVKADTADEAAAMHRMNEHSNNAWKAKEQK